MMNRKNLSKRHVQSVDLASLCSPSLFDCTCAAQQPSCTSLRPHSAVGDAPILPELLSQIPPDQEIASVTADRAYDTRKCHDAIAERGADAVIPPRKTAKPWKAITAGAVARNEALGASKYLGRALWRRWSGYHRRSRAETKMHCVKLPGQRLMARDFDRQVAEFQVRVAVLNGYTALGIPVTKVAG